MFINFLGEVINSFGFCSSFNSDSDGGGVNCTLGFGCGWNGLLASETHNGCETRGSDTIP